MYTVILGLHSAVRWAIVLGLAWALVFGARGWKRSLAVTAGDRTRAAILLQLTNVQLVLGLALYLGMTPWLPAIRLSAADALQNETIRFFGIEHPGAMFVALVILHGTVARFRAAEEGRVAWRRLAIGTAVATVLILAGIPWPFWAFGRPLLPLSG